MKKTISIVVLLSSVYIFAVTFIKPFEYQINATIVSDKNILVGEEINYVVKYSFISLGEVRIKVINQKERNGKFYYNTIAYINSYSGIPFVSLHSTYESKVSENLYSLFFRGIDKKKEFTVYTEYYFDYTNNKLRVLKGKVSPPEVWTDSTTTTEFKYQDGLSIFYYARMNSGQDKSVSVPCFVSEDKVFTEINFYKGTHNISINAVDYQIRTTRLDGRTDFISIFGLTGYFEGWFSDDNAAVPIVANMKVIIGNIRLELISWKRSDGWRPPKYMN